MIEHPPKKVLRTEYPRCPRCSGPVAGAMMTTNAIPTGKSYYYPPDAVSVFCVSGDCNYDMPLAALKTPVMVEREMANVDD